MACRLKSKSAKTWHPFEEEIEDYGIEPFVRRCQKSVFRYVKEWESLTRNIGFWVDLDNSPYHVIRRKRLVGPEETL